MCVCVCVMIMFDVDHREIVVVVVVPQKTVVTVPHNQMVSFSLYVSS